MIDVNEKILFDNRPDSEFWNEWEGKGDGDKFEGMRMDWQDLLNELKIIEQNRDKPFGKLVGFMKMDNGEYLYTIEKDWLYRIVQSYCCPDDSIITETYNNIIVKFDEDLKIELFFDQKLEITIRELKPSQYGIPKVGIVSREAMEGLTDSLRDDLVRYYGEKKY